MILDGWGYAPRTDGNAVALAHTPYYDEICRKYPMTTLSASGGNVGLADTEPGNADVGHLNIGTGRIAKTEVARIKDALASGSFFENEVIRRAFAKAKQNDASLHLIGLLSDGGVHSSLENLFALLKFAKNAGLDKVFVHCILDGLDVQPRTADVYVEALEIKLADIGVGTIATLCGRFFAMDSDENWERTARAFTMLVHAEGERTTDAVTAVRNSFLRGISDEFIAPVVIEQAPDIPVATVKNGDLVLFFNHRPDAMRQLARSLCIPEGASGAKPAVDTVCLTEYDQAFNLPVAFRQESERNALCEFLAAANVPSVKITEIARYQQLTYLFDGCSDSSHPNEQEVLIPVMNNQAADAYPESQSFRIADKLCRAIETSPNRLFVATLPAAEIMAATGDLQKTVSAIQYLDTCIGGICEKVAEHNGVVLITSTHGNCEEMLYRETGEPNPATTANPVPFHFIDPRSNNVRIQDGGTLADIAPTVLGLFGLEKPDEMTGSDLRLV